jgi:glycosyltransferase involved in cell wall biosynthesis
MQRKSNFKKTPLFPINIPQSNRKNTSYLLTHNEDEVKVPEIVFVTSYPPRECGIATYSQDLIEAIREQFDNSFKCSICALESDSEKHSYAETPSYILNTDDAHSYYAIAENMNSNKNIKLVVMQHEFGFFSKNEDIFQVFFRSIDKPIVFVFHTVLPHPDHDFKTKVKKMADIASSIIVMTSHAASLLCRDYDVSPSKIKMIPHGTHLVPPLEKKKLKQHYNLSHRKVLSTFGLLSSSKSIETTLTALPMVIQRHPELLFLVLGKTHPSIVKQEGESYREMLHAMVKTLKIENNVRFLNEYLDLPILLEYLQLTDIYIFTSKDPHQAVSGTFSYAVSCGCPVISTPIPHAKEVLDSKNGFIIDFGNSKQLAEHIISLLDNNDLRSEISSQSFHTMAVTAWQNSAISHASLFENLTDNAFKLNYRIPQIKLDHIKKMTTEIGMVQFSKISSPDIHSGYTLDDNARALIAICQHYELTNEKLDLKLIRTYIEFIKYCQKPNGQFLNYVNEGKEFTPQNNNENLEDSNGRALWALGYVCSLKRVLPIEITTKAELLIEKALPIIENIYSTRAMAFIIKGLYYQNRKMNIPYITLFADRLVQMYKHEKKRDWHWFESYLTYGNSLLPEALLCAYLTTEYKVYKTIALESFHFLLSKILNDNTIRVISNKGWYHNNTQYKSQLGGEQPIDVAYTILTLEKFYSEFEDSDYKKKALVAFSWFLGNNHLHQIVYNPCTGGCYDGVEEHNVNLNQGAESTLSYFMARLAIARMNNTNVTIPSSRTVKANTYQNSEKSA